MGFRILSNAFLWAANHKVKLHVDDAHEVICKVVCDEVVVGLVPYKNSLQERNRADFSFFANPFKHRIIENALPLLLKAKAMRFPCVGWWLDATPVCPRVPLLFPMTNPKSCGHRLCCCALVEDKAQKKSCII